MNLYSFIYTKTYTKIPEVGTTPGVSFGLPVEKGISPSSYASLTDAHPESSTQNVEPHSFYLNSLYYFKYGEPACTNKTREGVH